MGKIFLCDGKKYPVRIQYIKNCGTDSGIKDGGPYTTRPIRDGETEGWNTILRRLNGSVIFAGEKKAD